MQGEIFMRRLYSYDLIEFTELKKCNFTQAKAPLARLMPFFSQDIGFYPSIFFAATLRSAYSPASAKEGSEFMG